MTKKGKYIYTNASRSTGNFLKCLGNRNCIGQTKNTTFFKISVLEEDKILNIVASKRDIKGVTFVSHSSAWRERP